MVINLMNNIDHNSKNNLKEGSIMQDNLKVITKHMIKIIEIKETIIEVGQDNLEIMTVNTTMIKIIDFKKETIEIHIITTIITEKEIIIMEIGTTCKIEIMITLKETSIDNMGITEMMITDNKETIITIKEITILS